MRRHRDLVRAAVAVVGLAAGLLVGAVEAQAAHATANFAFERLAGPTRYDTAAAIATGSFSTAPTVVIATGESFPDALTASYLAGVLSAPVLLTTTHTPVPEGTLRALAALRTKNVYLLGGTSAIGDDVLNQLASTPSTAGGNLDVTRVGGTTRYGTNQTATTTAAQSGPAGSTEGTVSGQRTAIVASGANFPDALAMGPLVWARHLPIVLTDPTILSPEAAKTLSSLGIQQVLIAGGPAALSTNVEAQINQQGIPTLARLAGVNRSDTSRLVAEYAEANFGFSAASVDVATGDPLLGGADALAGGPAAGSANPPVPILVTISSEDPGADVTFAAAHASTLASGIAFGGEVALPDSTLAPITQASQAKTNATYTVTSGASSAVEPVGSSRSYAFANIGAMPADIKVASCRDVTDTNTTYTFTGSNPGGAGNDANFPTPNNGVVTNVNGVGVSPSGMATNVSAQNSTVTLTISDNSAECVVPVLFSRADGNDVLELAENGQPGEAFGVGGTTAFAPPLAPAGTFSSPGASTPTVTTVDTSDDYFVQPLCGGGTTSGSGSANPDVCALATYTYQASDTFEIFSTAANACEGDSFDDFQARLTVGDAVSGMFKPNGTSTFCLEDQAPAAPGSVTATTGSSGIGLSWIDSATASVEAYALYRARAVEIVASSGTVNGGWACPSAPPAGSPQTPPTSPFARIGTVGDLSAAGKPEAAYTFTDTAVTAGTYYCYALSAVDVAGQVGTAALASSTTPGPNVVQAPSSSSGPPAFASATASVSGSSVTLVYDEAVNCATVDADSSDFTASLTHNGVSSPESFTAAAPSCANSAPGRVGQIALSLGTAPSNGDTVTVTARVGNDHDTVLDNSGRAQAVGNTVTSSAAS